MLLSLVSLLGDLVYEGGRSVSGPLLESLGATLLVAGSLSGGEVLLVAGRTLGGLLAQRIGRSAAYWGIMIVGYSTNLAIPAIAMVSSWEAALALYMLERFGKGLRAPVRDAIIADVTSGMKRGLVFGAHELLDQIGAVLGPLVVFYLVMRSGYEVALLALSLPAILAILLILAAWILRPESESRIATSSASNVDVLWISLSTGLAMASLLHWGTASYAIGEVAPLLYAVAMAVDAVAAPVFGALYDRRGSAALRVLPVLSAASTLLFFSGNVTLFAIAWGLATSAYEVLPRAMVADVSARGRLGASYSVLYLFMGLGWLVGNVAMILISWKVSLLFATLSLVAQLRLARGLSPSPAGEERPV